MLRARLRAVGAQLLCVRPSLALARSDMGGRLATPDLVDWIEPATTAGVAAIAARDPSLGLEAATLLAPPDEPMDLAPDPEEPFEDPPMLEPSGPAVAWLKEDAPPFGGGAADTSRFMVGTVAVGLLLPESTGGVDPNVEDWTPDEVAAVQARALAALAWLAETEPSARLSFVVDVPSAPPPGGVPGTVATDTEPVLRFTTHGGWNFDEAVWTDVLARVGPPGGFTTGNVTQRRLAYARFLREKHHTNWAIVLLVADNSETRVGRASAFLYGPTAVLYSTVGASVFAHEIGHLFGARDEYHPDAAQSPTGLHGYLGVANANSQLDDGTGFVDGHGESVPSLMLNNVSAINPYTRIAWGWLDGDGDGLVDLFDQPPRVSLGAPVGAGPFVVDAVVTVGALAPANVSLSAALSLDAIDAVEWRVGPLGGAMGPWRPAEPTDGAFDSGQEGARVQVPALPEGSWALEVRARTLEGQLGTRRLDVPLSVRREGGPATAVLAGMAAPSMVTVGAAVTLDASGSTVLGVQEAALFRWDLDGDGAWDTELVAEPSITTAWPSAGIRRPRVEVQAGGASSIAVVTVAVIAGDLPPDAGFVVTLAHAVGTTNAPVISASPAGQTLGRWDWDGDGVADTPWQPLGLVEQGLSIPSLRIAVRGSAENPDGRAWRAVVQQGTTGWLVDADRHQVLAVDVSDPAEPYIVAATPLAGLHRFSDLALVGDELVVTRGAKGVTRLQATPDGGALKSLGAVAPGKLTDATGLALAGDRLLIADGAGIAVVDVATWALLSNVAHVAPGRIVHLDASGDLGCAVVREEGDPFAGALVTLDLTGDPVAAATVSLAAIGGLHGSGPVAVRAWGSLCIVADGGSGVRIFDATDPAAPVLRSTVDVEGYAYDAVVSPQGRLFIAGGVQVHVLDLADPGAPAPITAVAVRSPRGLWFGDDGRLHMAGGSGGYQVAELIEGEAWRSRAWTVGLEVQAPGGATAVSRRQVTAVSYGHAPVAALSATATPGSMTLDASASTDADLGTAWDGLLLARWDLDGDGGWDTGFSQALQKVAPASAPGVRRVRVQVRDRFWAVSEAEAEVCVPGPGGGIGAERCGNGRDDDCDGQTDEGFDELGAECTVGQGGCLAGGLWLCDPATGKAICGVPAGSEAVERCANGLDDDCDGETDEGFEKAGEPCAVGQGECAAQGVWECAPGATALACTADPQDGGPEECNGLDDDCDGDTDEGAAVPAGGCDGPDGGGCAGGTWACVEGALACVGDEHAGAPESCDGQDNDCDGLVDELWPSLGADCDGPDDDTCRRGEVACTADGLAVACDEDPAHATPEVCNGVDDDCDKQVDEGFLPPGTPCDGPDADFCPTGVAVCAPDGLDVICEEVGAAGVETCNGLDDDCDGDVDEGYGAGEPCDGPDGDLCEDGLTACAEDGESVACDEAPGPGWPERCNWLDDDCDGETDEGFGPLGAPCDGPDADACATGWLACAADGLAAICPETGGQMELCNGLDDDCDGETDEGFPLGAPCDGPDVDVCKNGVWVCAPGGAKVACGPESPANLQEQCNGLDDDCDGAVDEGCL